jgi:hypothetical protein
MQPMRGEVSCNNEGSDLFLLGEKGEEFFIFFFGGFAMSLAQAKNGDKQLCK